MSKLAVACALLAAAAAVVVGAAPQQVRDAGVEAARPPGKSIFTTIQGFVHGLYQEFLNRQQSIANLLTCGNCVNDGWDAIMTAVANVPGLDWAYKPQSDARPPSFFTALNQDGVITGFGGSIVDNKPVVEFVFDRDGIVQHLNTTNPDILKH